MQIQSYTRMTDAPGTPLPDAGAKVGGWLFLWGVIFCAAAAGLFYFHSNSHLPALDALVAIAPQHLLWACAVAAAVSAIALFAVIAGHLRAIGERNLRLAWAAEAAVDRLLEEIRIACAGMPGGGDDAERPLAKWLSENDAQNAEVGHLSRAVAPIPEAIGEIKNSATQSAENARNIAAAANTGATAAQNAITGITENAARIRDVVDRLKRLASDILEFNETVGMVGEVTEQAGVLSLNASLRGGELNATAVSEAGEVAEEMRRLADRATRGALQIRALVTSMKGDAAAIVADLDGVAAVDHVAADQAVQALADIQTNSRALLIAMKQTANGAADEAVQTRRIADRLEQLREAVTQSGANAVRIAERIDQLKAAAGIGVGTVYSDTVTPPAVVPANAGISPSKPEAKAGTSPSKPETPSPSPMPTPTPPSTPSPAPTPTPTPTPSSTPSPASTPTPTFPPPPSPKPKSPPAPLPPDAQ